MPMNSWDEDNLFEEWGWIKNLIQRCYEGPYGHRITFDAVMDATDTPEGEEDLRAAVRQYGAKQTA